MKRHIYEMAKAAARFVAMNWPFGDLWVSKDGKGGTIRVTKALMVITSDGKSTDMMPLNFCAQEFVDRVCADIQKRWYMPTQQANKEVPK